MNVTSEGSMKLYREMADKQPKLDIIPSKPRRKSSYMTEGRHQVSLISCTDRSLGIAEALKLLGGFKPLMKGVKGEIVIKPNCNTDDIYPRDTCPETIKIIASKLIENGAKPNQIVVGDMSGRARGLPTRVTVENLGIKTAAEKLGIPLAYFDEEVWVRVKPEEAKYWPDGLVIPKRIYDAERIIFTPILRSHSTANFTCAMKLGVGLIDARSRDWLHDGHDHYGKLLDINSAFSVDMVVSDALKMNVGHGTDPKDEVEPGIIIASDNIVANDAVTVALMRYYKTVRVVDKPTRDHEQFIHAKRLRLGSPNLNDIRLKTLDLTGSKEFSSLVEYIKTELGT
jgi:uncharacterized protein (DUF362 family)